MASFKQIMALCLDGASYAQISSALGYSNRDISRVKNVIEADGITREVFNELPLSGACLGYWGSGIGLLCVTTFCTLDVMASSVQKVVTHNTNYADTRYQLPQIDNQSRKRPPKLTPAPCVLDANSLNRLPDRPAPVIRPTRPRYPKPRRYNA